MPRAVERAPEFEGYTQIGYVEVFAGPMFSGKSDNLLYELSRARFAQKNVQVFFPNIDNRRAENTINSYSGQDMEAIPVASSQEILQLIEDDTDWVAIDEAQFLDMELPEVCHTLAARGMRVMVAGLSGDFRNLPFGPMDVLIRDAEVVHKLTARCNVCGNPASRTQRIVDGSPANWTDPTVVIGAEENYEARCRKCHDVPGKPEPIKSPVHMDADLFAQLNVELTGEGNRFEYLVLSYKDSRDFDELIRQLRKTYLSLPPESGFHSIYYSVLFSDVLSRLWGKGSEIFLDEVAKKDVLPNSNFIGDRLQAASCLDQVLEMEDEEFQNLFGQDRLL